MRGRRIFTAPAALLGAAIFLAGCAAPIDAQTLAAATVNGTAPTSLKSEIAPSSPGVFADMFTVDLTWDEVPGAEGYELQKTDDAYHYSTIPADEEQTLFTSASTTATVIGYDMMVIYRVRAVFDEGKRVSEWSKTSYVNTDPGNVHYEVEGTAGSASITMRTNSGSEQAHVDLPMKKPGAAGKGLWIQGQQMNPYISAQATGYGTVTCRITVMGQVVSENTASGYGSIATCSP